MDDFGSKLILNHFTLIDKPQKKELEESWGQRGEERIRVT
jgi:hypothetical protein